MLLAASLTFARHGLASLTHFSNAGGLISCAERGARTRIAHPPGETLNVGEGGGELDQTAVNPAAAAAAAAAALDIDLLADHEARTSLKQKTSKGRVGSKSSLAARLLTSKNGPQA